MHKARILWIDDEIDMLRAHIIFLEQKGYSVKTATNAVDALQMIQDEHFDIVFLDEHMPALTGIEALAKIKLHRPGLPVVMITKNEEETIMNDAIGLSIDDYLIKPVNPNQILLSLKKILEDKKIQNEKSTLEYQKEFRQLSVQLSSQLNHNEWIDIYKKIVYWDLLFDRSQNKSMQEILMTQKEDANSLFARFYTDNYLLWLQGKTNDRPVLSHILFKQKLFPLLDKLNGLFLIVIDNLRYDQWKVIQPHIEEYFQVETEDVYYSIIPTVTQFARNSMFAGLLPSEIQKRYPAYWIESDEETSLNFYEQELFIEQLKRFGKQYKMSFHKIFNITAGQKLVDNLPNLISNKINVVIYNFVDIMAHAHTKMDIIKELAVDESAYRSLTSSWFMHSPLYQIIQYLALKKIPFVLTTDHGSIQTKNPVKILGDRETNTNIRFKYGKNLNYESKNIFEITNPTEYFLPKPNVSTTYVFCQGYDYLVYPTNYSYYVKYFQHTFQHGGISMEEILVPFVYFTPKI